MIKSIWNDASLFWRLETKHGMRLTTAGLPVGEDCAVIACEGRLNQGERGFIVNLALRRIDPVDFVVGELLLIH